MFSRWNFIGHPRTWLITIMHKMHYCKFGLTDNENPPIPLWPQELLGKNSKMSIEYLFIKKLFRLLVFIVVLHIHVNEEAIKNHPLKLTGKYWMKPYLHNVKWIYIYIHSEPQHKHISFQSCHPLVIVYSSIVPYCLSGWMCSCINIGVDGWHSWVTEVRVK